MSKKISRVDKYNASADDIWAMLNSRDYVDAKYQALGDISTDVVQFDTGDAIALSVERVVPAELPDFAKKIMGDTNKIVQNENWSAAGGGYVCDLHIEFPGKPLKVTGDLEGDQQRRQPDGARVEVGDVALAADPQPVVDPEAQGEQGHGRRHPEVGGRRPSDMDAEEHRREDSHGKETQDVDGQDEEENGPDVLDEAVGVGAEAGLRHLLAQILADRLHEIRRPRRHQSPDLVRSLAPPHEAGQKNDKQEARQEHHHDVIAQHGDLTVRRQGPQVRLLGQQRVLDDVIQRIATVGSELHEISRDPFSERAPAVFSRKRVSTGSSAR